MTTGIDDVVAIVTGAGGGMGSAVARAFAREGRALVLADLDAAPLEALAATLGDVPVTIVAGDVTDPAYPARIVAALGDRQVDAFVHAAGVSPSMADGPRIYAINFGATKALVEALLPRMARGGVAVLIASVAGHMLPRALFDRAIVRMIEGKRSLRGRLMLRGPRTAYPVSKRAVQLYAARMAPAFGAADARIVSLSPGSIDTEMGRLEDGAGPEMAKMLGLTPLRRFGTADEIASVVGFLASPAAAYVNGTDILVDGGTLAGIAVAGGPSALR